MLGGIGRLLKGAAVEAMPLSRNAPLGGAMAVPNRTAIRAQEAANRRAIKGARARAGANRPESLGRVNYGRPGGPRGSGMPMTYRTPTPAPVHVPGAGSAAATRGAGLETRGVRPMPGTRVRRAPSRGIEGRGVRPAPGSRLRPKPGPMYGPPSPGPMHGPPSPGPMYGPPSPGPMYGPPKPGPIYGPPRPASSGTGATASKNVSAGNQPSRFRNMDPKTRRMLMIGGAAAVGVTAASNRRGKGTSSGRQSMTRY